MNLQLYDSEIFQRYNSNTQRARVLTENWAENNLFCPSCLNKKILRLKASTPVTDFRCDICRESFQLKSQNHPLVKKIVDGAFFTMIESIKNENRPNFLLLHYDSDYCIQNLLLIPYFFFIENIIEKRKPLSESARRKGWIGCNLLIERIPEEGKIQIVKEKLIIEKEEIHSEWEKIKFMKKIPLSERGWTIEVLNAVHSLNRKEFHLEEIYKFKEEFKKIHPNNSHIEEKIRQQLQILRDKGLLQFKGDGKYCLF